MVGNIAALDQYRVRQGQVLSAQDAWTKKITEGKATFGDLIKNHKMFSAVLRDQLALQNSIGVGWTQSSKTGKFAVDTFIPQNLPRDIRTARAEIGLMSNILSVASDNMIKWGKNTQWAGRQLMVGFTVPMGIAAAAAGKMAYDLDKALTQVVKVYGDAASGVQETSESIRNAAMSTAEAAARIYGQSAEVTLGIMADLAASGKSGLELQQATMATTRAAILGELDWQDAVKATISMQEVYQASQQDLANNWNYINAMENQTVLSAQDFVTAIPKVSGVMNELGADLKDTGALLTAFKAAGIDAAEGANALKSINFRLVATYGKGLETFNKYTGQDLRSLIQQTNGETIPSLQKFADAISDLSAPDKIAVTRDVFGIYQGSKALMLLEQMTQKTEQWQQALDVANNTNLQNAAIAQQELDRQSEQPFKAIDRAVATLQINLGKIGEAFLGPAATVVDAISKVISGINGMNPVMKNILAAGALVVALAGPLVMLAGLFVNLVGNAMKGVATLGMLVGQFKAVTVEERMQQIVSNKMVGAWDAQTSSVAALNLQLMHLNESLARASKQEAALATHVPFGPITEKEHLREQGLIAEADKRRAEQIYNKNPAPPLVLPYNQDDKGTWRGKGGTMAYPETARRANEAATAASVAREKAMRAEALATAQAERATLEKAEADRIAAASSNASTTASEKSALAARRVGQAFTGAAMGAGFLGSAMGMTEGVGGIMTNTLNVIGMLGLVAPKVMDKVGGGFVKLGTKIKGAMGGAAGGTANLLGMLKGAGPILAAVGLAGFATWRYFQNEIDKTRQKAEDFNNYAKSMADVLGYSYTDAGQIDPNSSVKDGQRATEILAKKFRDTNAAAAAAFSDKSGAEIGDKWGAAIAAGVEAKMHGATTEQANDTMRVAMQLMGQTFSDQDWQMNLSMHVDLDSMDSMINASIDRWKKLITDSLDDTGANWWETQFNSIELSQKSGEDIRKAGKDFWSLFYNTPKADREALLRRVAAENDKIINDAYDKAMKNKDDAQFLKSMGITNSTAFAQNIDSGYLTSTNLKSMNANEWKNIKVATDAMKQFTQATAEAAGVSDDAVPSMFRLFDLFRDPHVTELLDNGPQGLTDFVSGLAPIVNVADNAGGSVIGLTKAMEYFSNVGRGAAVDTEEFNKNLQAMGVNAAITYDVLESAKRNAFQNTQTAMFDMAMSQFDEMQQSSYDAAQRRGEAAMDRLDKKADAISDKYDKKEKALDEKQDKDKKKFDKAWDDREKREAAVYDNRIKKIEEQIEAEKKAEEQRQKAYEAEKTRIARLAEMYSTNIDINSAIDQGNLDEAAKLTADATARQQQQVIDDQAGASADASQKRIDALGDQKDAVEQAKKKRMDAIAEIRKTSEEAFKKSQDNEKLALKNAETAAKKAIDIEKKKQSEENRINLEGLKKRQADAKRRLEAELSEMRNFLPKNKKQLQDQATALKGVYSEFGVTLKGWGTSWSTYVGGELSSKIRDESSKIDSIVNWSTIGQDIANSMLKGAFNMTPAQFAAFINGGAAPKNSLFGTDPKSGVTKPAPVKPKYAGRANDPNMKAFHTGGIVGGGSQGRVGKSGSNLTASETMINALVGEGIVNRKGMSVLGKTGLDYINSGGGMGGGGMGMGALPMVMGAATGKMLIQKSIQGAYDKAMGRSGNYLGAQSGVAGPGIAATVSNIAGTALASQPAYKSGRVVYLGHGSYNGGANLGQTARPAAGTVVSEFGPRNLLGMTFHNGIDIANASGTPIHAAAAGKIIFTGWDNTGYGNYVQMQSPDGTMFGYGHNSTIGVRAGQRVAAGQIIARMGSTGKSTGPHSHFQTGRDGKWFNPRALFPQLNTGGYVLKEGLANLHPKEAVMTAPLTEKIERGAERFANGEGSGYTITMDFTNAHFETTADIEQAMENFMEKRTKKTGVTRKVGGN